MCQESLNSNPAILSSLLSLGQVDVALFFARGQRGSCFFAAAAIFRGSSILATLIAWLALIKKPNPQPPQT